MRTFVRKLDPSDPDPEILRKAGRILEGGGLVAFPTETVYGLGANALDPEAAAKIYTAKGRPSDNPLIVHIADPGSLSRIAKKVPDTAYALIRKYWPGPLTLIFEKTEAVPDRTSGGLSTVAVRMPDHPVALALIREAGGYVAAPSANASGRPSPTDGGHVLEDLNGKIDLILDAGPVSIGIESTIVDFTEEIPTVLRPGYITLPMLEEAIGLVRLDPGILTPDETVRPKAPGMRYRHYAPKADLILLEGTQEAVTAAIRKEIGSAKAEGKRTGVLCTKEHRSLYGADVVRSLGERENEDELTAHLYECLRSFDRDGVDVIYSEWFETPRLGMAILNRLKKAAGYRILKAD